MKYDEIYQVKDVWGKEPNKLLQMIFTELEPGAEFLDLGCGQGRDSLFMWQKGFKVTAVDRSVEGLKSLVEAVKIIHTTLKSSTLTLPPTTCQPVNMI
jgi:cyclopropane fatty-acyl-phospholipid synthase-like methyltransferase